MHLAMNDLVEDIR